MGCQATEQRLEELLRSADTPPFIGLAEISNEYKESALKKSKEFLSGIIYLLPILFEQYPFTSAWCVTSQLSDHYGEEGNSAIYKHLEDVFRVPLENQSDRKSLHRGFCKVCDLLGLTSKGQRMVDLYLLHAGVSKPMLQYLIEAFFRMESAFGFPQTESSEILNHWENDSLQFLPQSIQTPRRAILWDETSWYASLYAKVRQDDNEFEPKSQYEEHFFKVYKELNNPNGPRRPPYQTIPKPQLIWHEDGLTLKTPNVEGKLKIFLDQDPQPYIFPGGVERVLPQPWPAKIKYIQGNFEGELNFLTGNQDLAFFDYSTGKLLNPQKNRGGVIEIDTTQVVILSRSPYEIGENSAENIDEDCYISAQCLNPVVSVKLKDLREVKIRSRSRRRLTLNQGQIASGPNGILYSSEAILNVETGLELDEIRFLRVTSSSKSIDVPIQIFEGFGKVKLIDLYSKLLDIFPPDPMKFRIDLLIPQDSKGSRIVSGVNSQIWFWPAFLKRNGTVYESTVEPKNLMLEQSQHLSLDNKGCISLDPQGGYISAHAVFKIENELVSFDFPWSEVVVIRRGLTGKVAVLQLGERLVVGKENRFDILTIRCPDRHASLIVKGKLETNSFPSGLPRNLSMLSLMEIAEDNKVRLLSSKGNEILLFEITQALASDSVEFVPSYGGVNIQITLQNPIDAVALEIQYENDEKNETIEVGFGRKPVKTRRPEWLRAELQDNDARKVRLEIVDQDYYGGYALACIFLRPELVSTNGNDNNWCPLHNSKGEQYAFILGKSTPVSLSNHGRIFAKLNHWITQRYANESWREIKKSLLPRWEEYGLVLSSNPGGRGRLISMAHMFDNEAYDWVPVMHPIYFVPDLYNASKIDYAGLSGSQISSLDQMAKIYALSSAPLREQFLLHPTAYLAFGNIKEAHSKDTSLQNFDPRKFFKNLPQIDDDPSAGSFWHGTPILGSNHWRAAHLKFNERISLVGYFTDEKISDRQVDLLMLIKRVRDETEPSYQPPIPNWKSNENEQDNIGLWAAATLSEFARASRSGNVEDFISKTKNDLVWSEEKVLYTLALALRLAPELFSFFLLVWQLAEDRS